MNVKILLNLFNYPNPTSEEKSKEPMKNKTDFLYLLRFIAAVLVVIKHYSPIRNVVVDHCGEAVTFFFVLSGFILVVAYSEQIIGQNFDKFNFYLRRFARIYPLYLLALVLTLAYHFFIKNGHTHLAQKLPFESIMLQTWLYPGSINYPAWSVSCEVFFYFTFPFYILKLNNYPLKSLVILTISALVITLLVSYALYFTPFPFLRADLKEGYLVYHPILRFPTFLTGNLLGIMYLRNVRVPKSILTTLFLVGCFCIYLWSLNQIKMGLSLKQFGFVLTYVAIIVALLQSPDFSTKYLTRPSFILLGDISYGVYLLQYPVYSFTLLFAYELHPLMHFFIYLSLLILVSYLAYQYFEKPLRYKITNFGKSRFNSTLKTT
jgi:peptidoglycan/LPS O-acetylase OafA/YrhL